MHVKTIGAVQVTDPPRLTIEVNLGILSADDFRIQVEITISLSPYAESRKKALTPLLPIGQRVACFDRRDDPGRCPGRIWFETVLSLLMTDRPVELRTASPSPSRSEPLRTIELAQC